MYLTTYAISTIKYTCTLIIQSILYFVLVVCIIVFREKRGVAFTCEYNLKVDDDRADEESATRSQMDTRYCDWLVDSVIIRSKVLLLD